MRMTPGNNQRKHREIQIATSTLPLLQQHSVDVPLQMIHRDQWLLQSKCERLRKTNADQQSAGKSRTLRDRDSINRFITLLRFNQCLAHYRNDSAQMLAGSQFRDHSSIGLMSGDLRGHYVRQNLLPRTHHRRARFITGGFDTEDMDVGHNWRWR